ncbi:ATP-binding protein [Streptomyces sp. V2I9]|uniref:sensor histidine kinase n=1 Tax=Streptomyces sp. V2I9 TaxID=3042304 RepID=UPI0027866C8C|nr:ATP-binding protein [Streptomyces sp. V2I9]MDQ0984944.1 signal transduction histidine kinase [Streptomyces sp. V2I9]
MNAPKAAMAPLVATLSVTAVAGAVAVALAPSGARGWAVMVVLTAWVVLAVTLAAAHSGTRRAQRAATARSEEAERLKSSLSALETDTAHTADVALPALIQLVRGGVKATDALGRIPLPRVPRHRKLLHALATTVEEQERQTAALRTDSTRVHDEMGAENARLREELHALTSEVERFTRDTLPTAVARLREGESGATVQAEVYLPEQPLLRASVEAVLRELALSERRALAAQTASAKALSRVQAKSVSMLADLRSMQERHGEEVFGDLLKLDHSTSQLGLMTDRLALLMGGRPSRAWNRPIVMESILRGAVGRIAAYQRVRLHCSSTVSIAGFAAEGVMHLLAELMDNAANFSPPIDEVHVYVEERGTGVVVTIEDSGLKMAEAAMRRAADSVAGRMTDLGTLQGTRLGLAVVGRLALKHRISVNYRPSSRGGTGVVVLLPRHLIAQEARDSHPAPSLREATATAGAAPTAPSPVPTPAPVSDPAPTPALPDASGVAGSAAATPALPDAAPPPASYPSRTPAHGVDPGPARTPGQGLHQRAARGPAPVPVGPPSVTPPSVPPPSPVPADDRLVFRPREAERPAAPRPAAASTPGGLPVRTPGRTMGEAERERGRHRGAPAPTTPADLRGDTPRATPPRSAGEQFGAFHRARRPGSAGGEPENRVTRPGGGTTRPSGEPEGDGGPDARPLSRPDAGTVTPPPSAP